MTTLAPLGAIMGKGAVAPDLTGLGLPAPHVAAPTPPIRKEKEE